MRNWFTVAALGAVLTAAAVAAPPHRGPDADFAFLDAMADRLGLTESQEANINQRINSFRLDSAVDRERVAQLRGQLHELSRDGAGFDAAAAEALAGDMAAIVTRMAVAAAELRWQVRQELTAEQREQLDAWRGGRHHWLPPGPEAAF